MVPSETKGTEVSNDNCWPSSVPCILSCDGLDLHTLKPTVMGRAGVMKPPWPLHMEKKCLCRANQANGGQLFRAG